MSLLHEALKKAEREGTGPNLKAVGPSNQSGVSEKPPSIRPYILLSLAVISLLLVVYLRFARVSPQPSASQHPKLAAAAMATPKGPSLQELTEEGKTKLEVGDLESAKKLFDQVVLLDPRNAEAYNNLGLALKKMNRNEEAFQQYQKALALDPQCAECLNNLGVLYLSNHDLTEAESYLQKAIALRPDYANPYFHLALLLESRGDFVNAKKNYEKFVELAKGIRADLLIKIQSRMGSLKVE